MLSLTALLLTLSLPLTLAHPLTKRYSGVKIQSARDNLCLNFVGRVHADGVPVSTIDCRVAAKWDISPGSGSVILHGTNYALDAGTGDQNNEALKIWTSYPGLFQQTWYLTDDDHIAITGGNQCLDEGDNGPQTYNCFGDNINQIWRIYFPDEPSVTTTRTVIPETFTASTSLPILTVTTDVNGTVSSTGSTTVTTTTAATATATATDDDDDWYDCEEYEDEPTAAVYA
ncbi:hypothetical protein IAT38_001930 [Cryptococcus sp. DSM 104549]